MDRYNLMTAFVRVAETGSLSAAARSLNLSKSVISDRLAQLENWLGEPLLVRTTRRITLTEAGHAALPTYRELIERLDGALAPAATGRSALGGRLRVASTIDLGLAEASAAVSALSGENPGVAVELVLGDGIVDPVAAGFDVAVHLRRMRSDELAQHLIARLVCGVFAAPDYLAHTPAPDTPDRLGAHRCLGYTHQDAVFEWQTTHWTFARDGERVEARAELSARFNSSHALMAHALRGHGLAVLPHRRCRTEVADGRLVAVLTDWSPPDLEVLATTPAHARNPRAAAFVRHLRDAFGSSAPLSPAVRPAAR